MTPYPSEGTYTSESREVAVDETWDTWANPQASSNVEVVDGSLQLVEESAIPDSAIAHYDAQSAFGPGDGGTTVSTWPDGIGSLDLIGGAPTVSDGVINSNRALVFDATDDELSVSISTASQPNTHFLALDPGFSSGDTGVYTALSTTDSGNRNQIYYTNAPDWGYFAGGSDVNSGDQTTGPLIIAARFDGSNSTLRVNGVEVAAGDPGTDSISELLVGNGPLDDYFDGAIGEVLPCDAGLSLADIEGQEQRMAGRWGITL